MTTGGSKRSRALLTLLALLAVVLLTSVGVVWLEPASAVWTEKENTIQHRKLRELNAFSWITDIISFFKGLKYRWIVPELFETIPNPPQTSIAIVIGSGFGGSIAALRLAEAGIQTTVLERGQEWPISTTREIFPHELLRDGRGLWHRKYARNPVYAYPGVTMPVDKFGGILDITEYENIEVWRCSGVGGGSKCFTGVMIQPDQQYFDSIFEGTNITYEEMDMIYFPRVKEKLNLSPIPNDIYESQPWGKSHIWDKQARNAGYAIDRPDSIFNWDMIRDELDGKCRSSATLGMSTMGNSNGAKFDTTQNYLKEAEQTGFVEVFPNQQVTEIRETVDGYEVDIKKLDPFGKVVDEYSIGAEYLFLAAGSIGTSELLVKAKAKDTITGLNNEIGLGWGSNGDGIAVRVFSEISGFAAQGSPCSSMIHDADGPLPTTFEAWYVPGVPDIGFQGSLCMAMDMDNRGSFEYQSAADTVDLVWPSDGNDLAEESCRRVNNILAEADPKTKVGLWPFAEDVYTGFTAHPLGGAILGKATDEFGRVRNKKQLYVVDGALIPGTTGAVNPSLVISALAERSMENIVANDFP